MQYAFKQRSSRKSGRKIFFFFLKLRLEVQAASVNFTSRGRTIYVVRVHRVAPRVETWNLHGSSVRDGELLSISKDEKTKGDENHKTLKRE